MNAYKSYATKLKLMYIDIRCDVSPWWHNHLLIFHPKTRFICIVYILTINPVKSQYDLTKAKLFCFYGNCDQKIVYTINLQSQQIIYFQFLSIVMDNLLFVDNKILLLHPETVLIFPEMVFIWFWEMR